MNRNHMLKRKMTAGLAVGMAVAVGSVPMAMAANTANTKDSSISIVCIFKITIPLCLLRGNNKPLGTVFIHVILPCNIMNKKTQTFKEEQVT